MALPLYLSLHPCLSFSLSLLRTPSEEVHLALLAGQAMGGLAADAHVSRAARRQAIAGHQRASKQGSEWRKESAHEGKVTKTTA